MPVLCLLNIIQQGYIKIMHSKCLIPGKDIINIPKVSLFVSSGTSPIRLSCRQCRRDKFVILLISQPVNPVNPVFDIKWKFYLHKKICKKVLVNQFTVSVRVVCQEGI